MKLYITCEGSTKLKRSFLNLKLFSIVDVNSILKEYNYTYDTIDQYGIFIVNRRIMKLINNYVSSKRIRGIIYSNPNLNEDIINNLHEQIKSIDKIQNMVLLDDYNLPKLQNLYPLFDEVIFFPSIKKVRLIECKSIKTKIRWK